MSNRFQNILSLIALTALVSSTIVACAPQKGFKARQFGKDKDSQNLKATALLSVEDQKFIMALKKQGHKLTEANLALNVIQGMTLNVLQDDVEGAQEYQLNIQVAVKREAIAGELLETAGLVNNEVIKSKKWLTKIISRTGDKFEVFCNANCGLIVVLVKVFKGNSSEAAQVAASGKVTLGDFVVVGYKYKLTSEVPELVAATVGSKQVESAENAFERLKDQETQRKANESVKQEGDLNKEIIDLEKQNDDIKRKIEEGEKDKDKREEIQAEQKEILEKIDVLKEKLKDNEKKEQESESGPSESVACETDQDFQLNTLTDDQTTEFNQINSLYKNYKYYSAALMDSNADPEELEINYTKQQLLKSDFAGNEDAINTLLLSLHEKVVSGREAKLEEEAKDGILVDNCRVKALSENNQALDLQIKKLADIRTDIQSF